MEPKAPYTITIVPPGKEPRRYAVSVLVGIAMEDLLRAAGAEMQAAPLAAKTFGMREDTISKTAFGTFVAIVPDLVDSRDQFARDLEKRTQEAVECRRREIGSENQRVMAALLRGSSEAEQGSHTPKVAGSSPAPASSAARVEEAFGTFVRRQENVSRAIDAAEQLRVNTPFGPVEFRPGDMVTLATEMLNGGIDVKSLIEHLRKQRSLADLEQRTMGAL